MFQSSLNRGSVFIRNMANLTLSPEDKKQIAARGITEEKILSQLETFKHGAPFIKLNRPCIINDGVSSISEKDIERLIKIYSSAASSGRVMKFVPAAGAASRMFELLQKFINRPDDIDKQTSASCSEKYKSEDSNFHEFIKGLKNFAFYDELQAVILDQGKDIDTMLKEGQYKEIIKYILTPIGLNYANLPKGLVKFHHYTSGSRTSFEEHLVEGIAYAQDNNGRSSIHFTVSYGHKDAINEYINNVRRRYERNGAKLEIAFSTQKTSTDTIAVSIDNEPFRDLQGRLLFRPAGHGALLENLNDLNADVVFIKNIDNVVPDRLTETTYVYKKALGGYLLELQDEIFSYLKELSKKDVSKDLLNQAFEFARLRLSIVPPESVRDGRQEKKRVFLFSKLNRPLRVCGVVKNEGEPGGGPFWVEGKDNTCSLQLVENSQIDLESTEQSSILESSTHFSPVDLVCGVRNYLGRPFNLLEYTDPDACFISIKSSDGNQLKALELPGLWNGSMANWNTVFVAVPIITFNPVKTVLDLLRKEHQG